MVEAISEPAAAKVNVFLRVLGPREDGYHDLETLIQPITLADGVRVETLETGLSLTLAGEVAGVPDDGENLVLKAAAALSATCGRKTGARIVLVKRIPVAAGLGGGSADAAAALRGLNDLWGCGFDRERLAAIGQEVGSDVPAMVHGGPVLARGRGEIVEPAGTPQTWWVLLPLGFGVGSADAYRWWDEDGGSTGPDPVTILRALQGGDLVRAGRMLFNDLEAPVSTRHAEIAEGKARLLEAGALGAVMTGSGPTVAGLARDGRHAEELAAAVGGLACSSLSG